MVIPKGKSVEFKKGGTRIEGTEGVNLLLEEDVTLSLNSQFADLVSAGGNSAFSALGAISRDTTGFGFSGQFKELGFQVWQKTDPLQTSFTLSFNMITDAYTDVVVPADSLCKLPLPDDGGANDNGKGLVPPGPSILEALGDNQASAGKNLSCRIGNIWLKSIIVTRAEPTFSKECDQNGWPVWAKIRLDVRTIFAATTNMIGEMRTETF
jgi:hypothetical protein